MKLGNHRAALSILVHDLRDATSAEAYCTLGGEVVAGKIAQSIGEKYALQSWSSGLFSLPTSAAMSRTTSTANMVTGATAVVPMGRQKSMVDESVKKGLLKVLLEVYMNDGYVDDFEVMSYFS
jgi:vacuolar protein sorting-associated protein 3